MCKRVWKEMSGYALSYYTDKLPVWIFRHLERFVLSAEQLSLDGGQTIITFQPRFGYIGLMQDETQHDTRHFERSP